MKKITLFLVFTLFSTSMLLAQSSDKMQETKTPTLQKKAVTSQVTTLNDVSTNEYHGTKKQLVLSTQILKASSGAIKNKPKQANREEAKALSTTTPVSKRQQ